MDYTKIPRSLIYVDKRDLEEFRIDEKDTLNGKLYDKIMNYTDIPTFDNAEKIVLDCFNNAYYTIMLILHTKRPELHLGAYIDAMKPYGGYHQTAQHSMSHITFYIVDLYLLVLQEDWKTCALRKHLHQWEEDLDDSYYFSFDYNELHSSAVYTEDFKPCSIVEGIKHTFIFDLPDGIDYIIDEIRILSNKEQQRECIDLALKELNGMNLTNNNVSVELLLKKLSQELGLTIYEQQPEELTNNNPLQKIDNILEQDNNKGRDSTNALFNAEFQVLKTENQQLKEENKELKEKLENKQDSINDGVIEELKKENEELKNLITEYQMRSLPPAKRKGINLGLTPQQAVIFGKWLATKFEFKYNNQKELSSFLNSIFGWGISSLNNKMPYSPDEDELYVASIFGPYSPDTAMSISKKWNKEVLAPWENVEQENELIE